MAQSKEAADYRRWNRDLSGSSTFAAAATTTTLSTARNTASTIYIQRIIVYITTDAAQSWAFEDSSGKRVCQVPTSPGVNTRWEFFFGSIGIPLTEGANFVLTMSAAGLAGSVEWEGYARLTSPVAPGSTN